MTNITIERVPNLVTIDLYKQIALFIGIPSVLILIIFTFIAFHIKSKKWVDFKFEGRIIINLFALIMVGIICITLWNIKVYDKVEEKISFEGIVSDVGKDYITLKDEENGDRIFYNRHLKGKDNIKKEDMYNQHIEIGQIVKINTVKKYHHRTEVGVKSPYSSNDTYDVKQIKIK